MGITVVVKVEHLPIANVSVAPPASGKSRNVLVPNLDYHGTVKDTLHAFISRNLFFPEDTQLLSAPLFTRLSEKDNVDDIYKRYSCQVHLKILLTHCVVGLTRSSPSSWLPTFGSSAHSMNANVVKSSG